MRMKHSDDPTKFLESEVELHDTIKDLHAVATAPEHYGELIRLGAAKVIVGILRYRVAFTTLLSLNVDNCTEPLLTI